MKTFKLIAVAAIAILAASCSDEQVQMTTIINRNGSCLRTLSFAADSATLVGSYDKSEHMIHLLADSAWSKSWCIKGDTARHAYPMTPEQYAELRASMADKNLGDTLLVCAERRFASVEEMDSAMPIRLNGEPLQPRVSFGKRFRWFYTYYTYEETYPCQSSLFAYPLGNFVEEDVARYWFTGEPEMMQGFSPAEKKETYDMVEEQCNKWVVANEVAAAFDAVADVYDSLSDVPLDKATYMAHRDSLVQYALDSHFSFGDALDTLFSAYFHSHAYDAALSSSSVEQQLEAKMEAFMALMGLKVDYRLVLPGKIVDAGSGVVEEGSVRYRLMGTRQIPGDYTIAATSRAINVWAFILTALLLLAVVVGLRSCLNLIQ